MAMWDRVVAPRNSNGWGPSNWLLAALPDKSLSSFQAHLEAGPLAGGSVLCDIDEPVTRVYLVETGVVSLLTDCDSRVAVGAATVGPEGAVGVTSLLLGGDTALGRYQVLVPGSALIMEVPAFWSALRQSPKLRTACEAHTRALLVQMLQAVPCNRLHTVEQRCARWLLACADRTDDDTFELTETSLATMLAVPQSTVTAVGSTLQHAGLIQYRRGAIKVQDRRELEATACECYRIVRDRCGRILARAFD
jgi:CRP-like cAMP-binding protein